MLGNLDSITLDMDQTPLPQHAGATNIRTKVMQREHLWSRLQSTRNEIPELANMSESELKVKADMLERQYNTFEKYSPR